MSTLTQEDMYLPILHVVGRSTRTDSQEEHSKPTRKKNQKSGLR